MFQLIKKYKLKKIKNMFRKMMEKIKQKAEMISVQILYRWKYNQNIVQNLKLVITRIRLLKYKIIQDSIQL